METIPLTAAELARRRAQLFRQAEVQKQQLEGIFIHDAPNRFYLSGFWGTEGLLLLTREETHLIVDFRYAEKAAPLAELGVRVHAVELAGTLYRALRSLLRELGVARLGYLASRISVEEGETLRRLGRRWQWVPLPDLVLRLRARKSAREVAAIRAASRLMTRVLQSVLGELREGVEERELAAEIEYRARKAGAEGMAFETIVLFGEKTSLPHGRPGSRRLRAGDAVTIDAGARVAGYCTDITRTVAFGKPDPELVRIHRLVERAQARAIEILAPGKLGKEVDASARNLIARAGYGKAFGHGLGHGVGLEIHELPRLTRGSRDTLRTGMVVTIEPGIYLRGRFGVRIEDTLLVRPGEAEVLTAGLSRALMV